MEANNFLFSASQGKKTALDKAYYNHINTIIETLDEGEEERWETYSIIIQELVNQGKGDYLNEIKYRLTDGENPNTIILDIIEREVDEVTAIIWFLKRRVEEYLEDDNIRRFCD